MGSMRNYLLVVGLLLASCLSAPSARGDELAKLQEEALRKQSASWGHWGINPDRYATWSTHSNWLVPLYIFGLGLDSVALEQSTYRDRDRLGKLYGRLPEATFHPQASYFDQTDVYRLQQQAIEAGKKNIVLIVFDGLDWNTTRAAALYYSDRDPYDSGRGAGLFFQDYRGVATDFGYFVSSPYSAGADVDVDAQVVVDATGTQPGGYDPERGGSTPWARPVDLAYLIGQSRTVPHAYTDSAASATSMTCGIKTFNGAINVNRYGRKFVPIARQLQAQGRSIGVVTSVPISHATPAAAYANNVSRSDYQDLSRDLLGLRSSAHRQTPLRGVDVLLGAGWGEAAESDPGQGVNFIPGNRYLPEGALESISHAEGGAYHVVQRTAGRDGKKILLDAARMAAENGRRLFGFFGAAGGHLPFATADGGYDPVVLDAETRASLNGSQRHYNPERSYAAAAITENPTLADLTAAALSVLGRNRNGFWLMIEPGDVDWAMHGNNIDNAIGAIRSGEQAVRTLFDWIERQDAWEDTMVIVTADHGHLFVLREEAAIAAAGRKIGKRRSLPAWRAVRVRAVACW